MIGWLHVDQFPWLVEVLHQPNHSDRTFLGPRLRFWPDKPILSFLHKVKGSGQVKGSLKALLPEIFPSRRLWSYCSLSQRLLQTQAWVSLLHPAAGISQRFLAAAPQGAWGNVGSPVPVPVPVPLRWGHALCSASQKRQHKLSPLGLCFEWKPHEPRLLRWNRNNIVPWLMSSVISQISQPSPLPPPFVKRDLVLWKNNTILQLFRLTVMGLLNAVLAVIPGSNLFRLSQESKCFTPKNAN